MVINGKKYCVLYSIKDDTTEYQKQNGIEFLGRLYNYFEIDENSILIEQYPDLEYCNLFISENDDVENSYVEDFDFENPID